MDPSDPMSRSDRPRIAFFGLFGVGNYGNEASLSAGIAAVREQDPDADVWCICANPDLVSEDHAVPTFSIWSAGSNLPAAFTRSRFARLVTLPITEAARWIAAVRFARRCDRIIVPGTGILDDFGVGPFQMPRDMVRWTTAARIAGTPFAFVAVGAGPIEHRVSRWLMSRAAGMASYRSYRDPVSRSFMSSIGSDVSNDPVVTDVVFALDRPDPTTEIPDSGLRIGLGVMAYHGWSNDPTTGTNTFEAYVNRLMELTRRLIADGHTVRLLIGEDGDQVVVDLLTAAFATAGSAEDSSPVIAERIHSIADLLAQIQSTDAVIATRYHNVVAALLMERPTVSVGYAKKNEDLMRTVGLEAFCQHVDTFDVERTLDHLREVMALRPELALKIRHQVAENRQVIADQFSIALSLERRRRRFSRHRPTKGTQ